ncbi:MAG: ABC transporter permease subunit [Blastocatellia bacterium]|nr:ABC transporter permease subunit [Blastocatellia bacterium]
MAVFEQSYSLYSGKLTPSWSRFLIIPRHAYREIFRSKINLSFFLACFIYPFVSLILIYLHHNSSALQMLDLKINNLIAIDSIFFYRLAYLQGIMSYLFTLMVGPDLVARDLTNNALPLYLCRPLSRTEYVLGKMSTVLILLSAFTWLPATLLFFFQVYLEGSQWWMSNYFMLSGLIFGNIVWIVMIALLSQVISAWVKWKVAARGLMFGLYFVSSIVSNVFYEIFEVKWAKLLSIGELIRTVWRVTLQHPNPPEVSIWSAITVIGLVYIICICLLTRRVRAYEVIS